MTERKSATTRQMCIFQRCVVCRGSKTTIFSYSKWWNAYPCETSNFTKWPACVQLIRLCENIIYYINIVYSNLLTVGTELATRALERVTSGLSLPGGVFLFLFFIIESPLVSTLLVFLLRPWITSDWMDISMMDVHLTKKIKPVFFLSLYIIYVPVLCMEHVHFFSHYIRNRKCCCCKLYRRRAEQFFTLGTSFIHPPQYAEKMMKSKYFFK